MEKIKNIILLLLLVLVTNCGYVPLSNINNVDFNINNLILKGDRKINNYISNNLKRYQNIENSDKIYNVNLSTEYLKSVINKDKKGNPKTYELEIKASIEVEKINGEKINKDFIRNNSLSSKEKKVKEKELEIKYKKDLANLISKDIIFFLTNQQ